MEIAKLFASLGLRPDEKSFAKGNKLIGGVKTALAAFAGFELVKGVASAVNATVELGGHLDDLRQKTGLTAEALQEYGYAAKLGGSSMDGFADGARHVAKTLVDAKAGSAEASRALAQVGIQGASLTDALKGGAGLDGALMQIADRFAAMPNGAQKTALAMQIFGKSGADMIPTLNLGRSGLKALRQEAEDLGVVLSDGDVDGLDKLGDDADKAKMSLAGLKNQAVAALAPAIQTLVTGLLGWIKANRDLIKSGIAYAVQGLTYAAQGAAVAIEGVVAVIDFMREHGDLARAILIAVGVAFGILAVEAAAAWIAAAAPVVAVIAAIAAVILIVQDLWNSFMHGKGVLASVWLWIKEKLSAAGHAIGDAFRSVWQGVKEKLSAAGRAIGDAFGAVWRGIKRGFSAAFDFIADLPVIKQLIWMINKLDKLVNGTQPGIETYKNDAGQTVTRTNVRADRQTDAQFWDGSNMMNTDGPVMPGGSARASSSKSTTVNAPVNITVNSTASAAEVAKQVDNRIGQHVRNAFASAGGDE